MSFKLINFVKAPVKSFLLLFNDATLYECFSLQLLLLLLLIEIIVTPKVEQDGNYFNKEINPFNSLGCKYTRLYSQRMLVLERKKDHFGMLAVKDSRIALPNPFGM